MQLVKLTPSEEVLKGQTITIREFVDKKLFHSTLTHADLVEVFDKKVRTLTEEQMLKIGDLKIEYSKDYSEDSAGRPRRTIRMEAPTALWFAGQFGDLTRRTVASYIFDRWNKSESAKYEKEEKRK